MATTTRSSAAMRSAGTTIRGGRGWSGPRSHRPSLGPLRASPVDVAAFAKQTRSSRLVPPPPKLRGEYGSNKRSYVEEYDVREAETLAETDMVSPVVVTKIIESLAIGHFQELSGDRSDVPRSAEMKDLDLTFMLSRITFSFADLPSTSDTIEAETCFKPQKVSFKRDFAVRNKTAGGAAVAAATSTYVLVNFCGSLSAVKVVVLRTNYAVWTALRRGGRDVGDICGKVCDEA